MRLRALLLAAIMTLAASTASADMFLVTTAEGPGFASPDEVADVLEKGIIPTFEALLKLKSKKVIVTGGLPVGSRKFVLFVEADSHDAVDRMLRDLPAWGVFSWKVTAMQSIDGRMKMEREIVKELKAK